LSPASTRCPTMIEDMTDQAKSPRSRRGSVAPGPASRRPAISTSRVPRKAQEAVDKLLDKIRAKADKGPSSTSQETKRKEKRDANGYFAKGTKPGPGRPSGSPNKIPKSIKQVVRDLCEGVIEVTYKDPATEKLVEGPVAHLLAERMVAGLNDPQNYPAFVKMFLEYGIGRPKTQTEVGAEDRRQIPKMIFLNRPHCDDCGGSGLLQ